MFSLLASVLIGQAASPQPEVITVPQEIRSLPGGLDRTLVFNSNSPEVVQTEGILLSTFPQTGKSHPQAHLDQRFNGRFDLFAHHIAKALSPDDLRTLYLGVIVHNPSDRPVKLDVLQSASYLSQPDAPFIKLDAQLDNASGDIFAGPGDRATNDVLRGKRQESWPASVTIAPNSYTMLLNVPIPVKELEPPINGRSTLARLRSNGPVYMASLAMFAKSAGEGERAPTLDEWKDLLTNGNVAGPRDKAPTPPGQTGAFRYGRVAGVARGSVWNAHIYEPESGDFSLSIPEPGAAYSYPLSSLERGTFGTGQIQTAPLLKRYEDTAYAAHGNYGVEYRINLPLKNTTDAPQTVHVKFQTALKTDVKKAGLEFRQPPANRVFFRGTVRTQHSVSPTQETLAELTRLQAEKLETSRSLNLARAGAVSDNVEDLSARLQQLNLAIAQNIGRPVTTQYTHLVQLQGQESQPLLTIQLEPQQKSLIRVDFIYPADATPPQVLTVETAE